MKKLIGIGLVVIFGTSAFLGFRGHPTSDMGSVNPNDPASDNGSVTVIYSSHHALPDPTLTPGAINPDITQANISQNICNPSWSTKSIRPTSSYTTALKIKQIVQYGYTDSKTASYEEDHLISLELGGNPASPLNLWPELYVNTLSDGTNVGAKVKDTVENWLHAQVCNGSMTLAEAQIKVSTNWIAVLSDMHSGKLGAVIEPSTSDDE